MKVLRSCLADRAGVLAVLRGRAGVMVKWIALRTRPVSALASICSHSRGLVHRRAAEPPRGGAGREGVAPAVHVADQHAAGLEVLWRA